MSIPLNPEAILPADFVAFTHEGVLLAYDPLTGKGMRWITKSGRGGVSLQWSPITPGATHNGRSRVNINGAMRQWHRVVAQHFLNEGNPIPTVLDVDHRKHVDGTAAQDILTNLRIISRRENHQNRKPSSSQFAGVHWHKQSAKWTAQATSPLTGKLRHLGCFTNEREAAQAYIDYCIQHNLPHTPAAERLAAA